MDWTFQCISGDYFPRQFEYNPQNLNQLIFGTVFGEVCGVNLESKEIVSYGYKGKNKRDTILGLRWMKKDQGHLFFAGTADGKITCNDSRTGDVVKDFVEFEKLTSVHLSCDNHSLLISGYRKDAHIYDVETGKVIREFLGVHEDHINISRFSNHSPNIFSTSSFDSMIKTWDTRMSNAKPIYSLKANSGIVMINFSSDDNFILASALDNEINQYLFVDGRLHLSYDIPTTGLKGNFTRAYYSSSGKYTITGACEERNIKFLCSYTGEYLSSVDMYPASRSKSIYIQSLRGNPTSDHEFCVLANYRDNVHRELIIGKGAVRRADEVPGFQRAWSQPSASTVMDVEGEQDNLCQEKIQIGEYLPFSSSLLCDELFKLRLAAIKEVDANEDVVVLLHNNVEGITHHSRFLQAATERGSFEGDMDALLQLCFGKGFHRIHTFIILSRCPAFFELYQQQSSRNSIDLTATLLPKNWFLVSLLIDYLYIGFGALEIATLKGFALALLFAKKDRSLWDHEKGNIMRLIPSIMSSPDELTLMCVDESVWRLNYELSICLCNVVIGLFEISESFSLTNLGIKCCELLGDILNPLNALFVTTWAATNNLTNLYEKCIVFCVRNCNIISFKGNKNLFDCSREVSSAEFKASLVGVEQKMFEDISAQVSMRTPIVITRPEVLKGKSSRMISATVLFEDCPFLANASGQITHTVIPKQYNHASCVFNDRYIVFFGGISADRWLNLAKLLAYDTVQQLFFYMDSNGTRVPTLSNYSSAVPLNKQNAKACIFVAGKIRRGDRAESKASIKTNSIWHTLNKNKINGLNPKAVVKSIARYEEEEDEAEKSDANIDPSRVFLNEYNFSTATWNLVQVHIEDSVSPHGRISRAFRSNPILNLDADTHEATASERELVVAFCRRLGCSVSPLYLEDIPYRCARCLFTGDMASCSCSFSTDNRPSDECCYVLQFGGYCTKTEEFMNDLHVLNCSTVDGEDTSMPRYRYTWKKVRAQGVPPSPRYSHASAAIPANAAYPANNFARILVFGGASFAGHVADLACLRIKPCRKGDVDAMWETVQVRGTAPARRYKHTLNYIAASNICVMFGGCGSGNGHSEQYNNELWTISWSYNQQANLEYTWHLVQENSCAPDARSYHTCNVIGSRMFVFGGANEMVGSPTARDEKSEERIKESLMHICDVSTTIAGANWLNITDCPSRMLLIEREPDQPLSFCSLGADLRNLLFTKRNGKFAGNNQELLWQRDIIDMLNETGDQSNPFIPNIKISIPVSAEAIPTVDDEGNIVDAAAEGESYDMVLSYGALVCGRCSVFEAMLGSSMIEAQTREIKLSAATEFDLFVKLMEFICSNYIGSSDLEHMVGLLGLANEYAIATLVKKCEGALLRMINFSTVCEILSYAEWLGLDLLRIACYSQLFRSRNIKELIKIAAVEDMEVSVSSNVVEGDDEEENEQQDTPLAVFKELPVEVRTKFAQFALTQNHVAVASLIEERLQFV